MSKVTVVEVSQYSITFSNGDELSSSHESSCCEEHFLSFNDLSLKDFDGLEFNLEHDNFFKKIDDYGIELIPLSGWGVKVPGYGFNNGYYSSDLTLEVGRKGKYKTFDISECQIIGG